MQHLFQTLFGFFLAELVGVHAGEDTIKTPKRKRSQIPTQLRELGRMAAWWNELEWRVRLIILKIAPDTFTAAILIVDMQISGLLATARIISREREAINQRAIKSLKADYPNAEGVPYYAHIDFFLEAVDRLREHRNHFVHNASYGRKSKTLTFTKFTARGRLSHSSGFVKTEELKNVSLQIGEFITYADKLLAAIDLYEAEESRKLPTWPKRPPLPDKWVTHRTILLDVIPQQEPSEE